MSSPLKHPTRSARVVTFLVVGALVLFGAACGDDDGADDLAAGTSPGQTSSAGGGGSVPSGCPLTPEEVAAAVGRQLAQSDPNTCRFSDGAATVEGVVQGAGYYQIGYDQAATMYDAIEDAGKGSSSYVATSDTGAEAFVEAGSNSVTITMSGIEGSAANYKQVGLKLLDAALAS